MIAAIIPAAGRSSRMGRPKLSLPLGDDTVLGHVIRTLRDGGADRIVTVLGPHPSELERLARSAGAEICLLQDHTADMRETVVRGLDWLEEHLRPSTTDAFLLMPGDMPGITSAAIRRLIAEHDRDALNRILVPQFRERSGHPTLIPWSHAAGIRAIPAGQGIDSYLRTQGANKLGVHVDDAGVLSDLDTPDDYERLFKSAPE
jgi:molybdenum cofactor cytidylyltransferase